MSRILQQKKRLTTLLRLLAPFLLFAGACQAQNVGIGTTTPQQKLHVEGNLFVKDSIGINVVNPKANLDVNGSLLLRGQNSNSFGANIRAAVELYTGRNSNNQRPPGATVTDMAFNYAADGGGFRHFLATRHSNATLSGNAIDFYLNYATDAEGSSSPGVFNANMLSITLAGVGINKLNPMAPLHFAEDFRNRKIVLLGNLDNDQQFLGFGVNPGMLRYQVGNSNDSHVFFSGASATASTELFRITGTGDVGIGTSTPNAQLQLSNILQNRKIVLWDGDVNNNHNFFGFGINNNTLRYQVSNVTDSHVFFARSGSNSSAELMRITGTGNVGIGTSAPNAPLQLSNALLNRKIVLWDNQNNDHNFNGFGINPFMLRYQINTPNDSHVFFAGTNDATPTSLELMRITGNGNVGIGTNAPTQKLDVNGNARISGILNVDSIEQDVVQVPTLSNGWINYGIGFADAGFYKDREGIVRLRGLIKNGAIATNTLLFTLPVAYRPTSGRLIFTVDNTGTVGRIDVLANGELRLITAINSTYLNLTGIAFRAD